MATNTGSTPARPKAMGHSASLLNLKGMFKMGDKAKKDRDAPGPPPVLGIDTQLLGTPTVSSPTPIADGAVTCTSPAQMAPMTPASNDDRFSYNSSETHSSESQGGTRTRTQGRSRPTRASQTPSTSPCVSRSTSSQALKSSVQSQSPKPDKYRSLGRFDSVSKPTTANSSQHRLLFLRPRALNMHRSRPVAWVRPHRVSSAVWHQLPTPKICFQSIPAPSPPLAMASCLLDLTHRSRPSRRSYPDLRRRLALLILPHHPRVHSSVVHPVRCLHRASKSICPPTTGQMTWEGHNFDERTLAIQSRSDQ
ncbi:hypothetical protein RSAG8_04499, partial [Rhizoctonia solani AG-8 WAC10335]